MFVELFVRTLCVGEVPVRRRRTWAYVGAVGRSWALLSALERTRRARRQLARRRVLCTRVRGIRRIRSQNARTLHTCSRIKTKSQPGGAYFAYVFGNYDGFADCSRRCKHAQLCDRLASSQIRPACRRIHVFTTNNAYSTLLVDKVRQNLPACHKAVWPRILEVEKVYRTRVKLNIFMFSRSQMLRNFEF